MASGKTNQWLKISLQLRSMADQELSDRQARKETYVEEIPKASQLSKEKATQLSDYLFDFKKNWNDQEKISILQKYFVVKGFYDFLVPDHVSEKDFWLRYGWRCDKNRIMKEFEALPKTELIKLVEKQSEELHQEKSRVYALPPKKTPTLPAVLKSPSQAPKAIYDRSKLLKKKAPPPESSSTKSPTTVVPVNPVYASVLKTRIQQATENVDVSRTKVTPEQEHTNEILVNREAAAEGPKNSLPSSPEQVSIRRQKSDAAEFFKPEKGDLTARPDDCIVELDDTSKDMAEEGSRIAIADHNAEELSAQSVLVPDAACRTDTESVRQETPGKGDVIETDKVNTQEDMNTQESEAVGPEEAMAIAQTERIKSSTSTNAEHGMSSDGTSPTIPPKTESVGHENHQEENPDTDILSAFSYYSKEDSQKRIPPMLEGDILTSKSPQVLSEATTLIKSPTKSMVVLVSKSFGTAAQRSHQDRSITTLMGQGIPFEEVDGSDPSLKDIRNDLFAISGVRGNYPQFFIQDGDDITFLGNYETFEQLNESGNLSAATEQHVDLMEQTGGNDSGGGDVRDTSENQTLESEQGFPDQEGQNQVFGNTYQQNKVVVEQTVTGSNTKHHEGPVTESEETASFVEPVTTGDTSKIEAITKDKYMVCEETATKIPSQDELDIQESKYSDRESVEQETTNLEMGEVASQEETSAVPVAWHSTDVDKTPILPDKASLLSRLTNSILSPGTLNQIGSILDKKDKRKVPIKEKCSPCGDANENNEMTDADPTVPAQSQPPSEKQSAIMKIFSSALFSPGTHQRSLDMEKEAQKLLLKEKLKELNLELEDVMDIQLQTQDFLANQSLEESSAQYEDANRRDLRTSQMTEKSVDVLQLSSEVLFSPNTFKKSLDMERQEKKSLIKDKLKELNLDFVDIVSNQEKAPESLLQLAKKKLAIPVLDENEEAPTEDRGANDFACLAESREGATKSHVLSKNHKVEVPREIETRDTPGVFDKLRQSFSSAPKSTRQISLDEEKARQMTVLREQLADLHDDIDMSMSIQQNFLEAKKNSLITEKFESFEEKNETKAPVGSPSIKEDVDLDTTMVPVFKSGQVDSSKNEVFRETKQEPKPANSSEIVDKRNDLRVSVDDVTDTIKHNEGMTSQEARELPAQATTELHIEEHIGVTQPSKDAMVGSEAGHKLEEPEVIERTEEGKKDTTKPQSSHDVQSTIFISESHLHDTTDVKLIIDTEPEQEKEDHVAKPNEIDQSEEVPANIITASGPDSKIKGMPADYAAIPTQEEIEASNKTVTLEDLSSTAVDSCETAIKANKKDMDRDPAATLDESVTSATTNIDNLSASTLVASGPDTKTSSEEELSVLDTNGEKDAGSQSILKGDFVAATVPDDGPVVSPNPSLEQPILISASESPESDGSATTSIANATSTTVSNVTTNDTFVFTTLQNELVFEPTAISIIESQTQTKKESAATTSMQSDESPLNECIMPDDATNERLINQDVGLAQNDVSSTARKEGKTSDEATLLTQNEAMTKELTDGVEPINIEYKSHAEVNLKMTQDDAVSKQGEELILVTLDEGPVRQAEIMELPLNLWGGEQGQFEQEANELLKEDEEKHMTEEQGHLKTSDFSEPPRRVIDMQEGEVRTAIADEEEGKERQAQSREGKEIRQLSILATDESNHEVNQDSQFQVEFETAKQREQAPITPAHGEQRSINVTPSIRLTPLEREMKRQRVKEIVQRLDSTLQKSSSGSDDLKFH